MTAPRQGGGEGLLKINKKAQPKARTSERIHSGHDPEPHTERGEGKREERKQEPGAAAGGPKESRGKGQVTNL